MKARIFGIFILGGAVVVLTWLTIIVENPKEALSYPPGVGILGKSKNCLNCHLNNGPWKDDEKTIIDILEKETKKSLRQSDGSFLISVKRNQIKTILTVIGRSKDDKQEAPYRNAWLYVDPKTIGSSSLSKFAAGWDVNLPMSCRIVGDTLTGYEGAKITVLPMTIRPLDAAQDAELNLQVMLTKGESVKGDAKEGMIGSYFERTVRLKVIE
ncbi:MAG TPA: hypothetical protein VJ165_03685 [candidate division Zixibacteria bacterium]|nr:hypothetical protein [candidate division Zixibacteria bacterium]